MRYSPSRLVIPCSVFRSNARKRVKGKPGFALIVMLMMMVLLTMLALGLLSLSSITLRGSETTRAQQTAHANARLAMIIAIGELQKQAGPDQRITATADMAADNAGVRLLPGAAVKNDRTVRGGIKGLSQLQNGTRYWTGVWRNGSAISPETQLFMTTPSPVLVKWLVSGNEMANVSAIMPSAATMALGSTGNVTDPKKAVILVGAKTVGAPSVSNLPRYVSVPLVIIKSTTNPTVALDGRYGWWIGDEGVKARLNSPSNGSTLSYANLNSTRRGWETAGLTQYPLPTGSGDALLSKVVTFSGGESLASTLRDSSTGPLGQIFHAATCDSSSVLSNPMAGGLQFDLSAWLDTLPTSTPTNAPNAPMAGRNMIPSSISGSIRGPKWDQLKAFKNRYSTLSGGRLICSAATSDIEYAIAPVLADIRVLMGVKLHSIDDASYRLSTCGKVAVVLANPYPYPLKWTTPLDLEFKHEVPPNSSGTYYPSCIWNVPGKPAYLPSTPTQPAVFNKAIFQIAAGEIPAGEARGYTMTAPVIRPAATAMTPVTVPMGPIETSDSRNFDISVQQMYDTVFTATYSMEVRESWITSPLTVELRPSGSTNLLRRIDSFELDTAQNFVVAARSVGPALAKKMIRPFPLMHYSFQLSQPGVDYSAFMPSPDQNGLLNSTLRTFTDFNLQATRFRKPITSYNPPPYFMEWTDSASALPFAEPGGDTGDRFVKNIALTQVGWGRSPFESRKVILFSPPQTLVSLAQFQHADLTADDVSVSVAHQPGNAVGNSYAPLSVKRSLPVQNRNDYVMREVTTSASTAFPRNYYDISYLLNTALWDSCYFSTIPRTGSAEPLNKAIVKTVAANQSPELRDGLRAAGHLMINGGFNINCTEKEAWKALLAGSKYMAHAAGGSSTEALYARSPEQTKPHASPPTGNGDDSFAGFRRLTDVQIDTLAEEIVKQVRLRGPFLSVSHFVNRSLVDPGTSSADEKSMLGRSGALQSALDLAGVNIKPDGSVSPFTRINSAFDKLNLQASSGTYPKADLPGSIGTQAGLPEDDWDRTSKNYHPGSVASMVADRTLITEPGLKAEQGFRSTGIPGWLTQADLLQVIGPSITARSDTFRIRAYGEAVDTSGKTTARAWCEAIVQRNPSYVDMANAPSDRGAALRPINATFGRSFALVSFRWLSPDEI